MSRKKTNMITLSIKEFQSLLDRSHMEGRNEAKYEIIRILKHARLQPKKGINYLLKRIKETV